MKCVCEFVKIFLIYYKFYRSFYISKAHHGNFKHNIMIKLLINAAFTSHPNHEEHSETEHDTTTILEHHQTQEIGLCCC